MNATMPLESVKHYPVMLNQILSILSPQHGGTFIDCTFGGGGYSKAILKYTNTRVLAFDRDTLAEEKAKILLNKFPKRFNFFKERFSNIDKVIKSNLDIKAIIFDLGLSSHQIEDKKRGFSFQSNSFLNMEMGLNERSAYDVINTLDNKCLGNIIKLLGEEKDGKIIANKIVKYRNTKKISSSQELASIIKKVKEGKKKYKKNPATKTFQAIRIFVNKELTELISGLIEATRLLPAGGILIVVSFHSLEDKIVKSFFNSYSNFKKNPSRYLPVNKETKNLFKLLLKKPLVPTLDEVEKNTRSRSAKLRYGIRNEKAFFFPDEFKKKFETYLRLEEIIL